MKVRKLLFILVMIMICFLSNSCLILTAILDRQNDTDDAMPRWTPESNWTAVHTNMAQEYSDIYYSSYERYLSDVTRVFKVPAPPYYDRRGCIILRNGNSYTISDNSGLFEVTYTPGRKSKMCLNMKYNETFGKEKDTTGTDFNAAYIVINGERYLLPNAQEYRKSTSTQTSPEYFDYEDCIIGYPIEDALKAKIISGGEIYFMIERDGNNTCFAVGYEGTYTLPEIIITLETSEMVNSYLASRLTPDTYSELNKAIQNESMHFNYESDLTPGEDTTLVSDHFSMHLFRKDLECDLKFEKVENNIRYNKEEMFVFLQINDKYVIREFTIDNAYKIIPVDYELREMLKDSSIHFWNSPTAYMNDGTMQTLSLTDADKLLMRISKELYR